MNAAQMTVTIPNLAWVGGQENGGSYCCQRHVVAELLSTSSASIVARAIIEEPLTALGSIDRSVQLRSVRPAVASRKSVVLHSSIRE
jgi:hypothetical protein